MLTPASPHPVRRSPFLTPPRTPGHKCCPYCHSEDVQRAELIYETGAPAPNRIKVVSPLYARVVKQALADRAAPPGTVRVKDVWEEYIGRAVSDWMIALFAGALAYFIHWYWLLPLIPVLPAWFSWKYFREGRQALQAARAQNESFLEQYSEWKRSYVCMACGASFNPEPGTANDAAYDNPLEHA
jgi:hypothetical protein